MSFQIISGYIRKIVLHSVVHSVREQKVHDPLVHAVRKDIHSM